MVPLLVLYWPGAIPARGVLGGQMLLMIPAMVLLMVYRKEEYSAPHPRAGHLHHRRWFAGAH